MARWSIVRQWPFEGPAEAGSDADGGWAFALRSESGEERQVAAGGVRAASASDAATALQRHRDDPEPPRYITLDREGRKTRPG